MKLIHEAITNLRNVYLELLLPTYLAAKRETLILRDKNDNILIFNSNTSVSARSRWRNGLARLQQWSCYLQEPGFKSHL